VYVCVNVCVCVCVCVCMCVCVCAFVRVFKVVVGESGWHHLSIFCNRIIVPLSFSLSASNTIRLGV
jgi:hypothetical protein